MPGLRRVDGQGITEVEPHAAGLAALHSPATAITDYVAVAQGVRRRPRGGRRTHPAVDRVTGIASRAGRSTSSPANGATVDHLVICAGLQADRVSRLADGVDGPRIVPFRGEYMTVEPAKRDLVRGMIYPVPDPRYPFLGVHFTRRVSGELEVGPNAVLALDREATAAHPPGSATSAASPAGPASGGWPGGTGVPALSRCAARSRCGRT